LSKRIRVCEFNSCRHKSQGGGDHGVAGYIVKKNKPVKCAEEGESAVFREDIEQIVFIELENGVNGCYGMENDYDVKLYNHLWISSDYGIDRIH